MSLKEVMKIMTSNKQYYGKEYMLLALTSLLTDPKILRVRLS